MEFATDVLRSVDAHQIPGIGVLSMNKIAVLVSAVALTLVGSAAVMAGPQGFDQQAGYTKGAPAGFGGANAAPQTVQDVLKNGYDDQRVTLTGKLTRYLGHDCYEFVDNTGSIEIELDDDRDWSHISKDQLIVIFGKIDRDFRSISIDVKDARPAN